MIVRTSPRFATIGSRLRNAVLVAFALFVAHDAIYVAQYGVGTDLARAMTAGGHDGYWAPLSLVIAGAGALAFLITIGLLGRLERRASQSAAGAISAGPGYVRELASTWIRLFPLVALLFGLQENLERFVADGHLVGLWALFGPDASAVMPVLALTTFVLAGLGSLIRWRVRVLAMRITAANRRSCPHRVKAAPVRPRLTDLIPNPWILDRPDAGRAPPAVFAA